MSFSILIPDLTCAALYHSSCETPTLLTALSGKQTIHIDCGGSYSAAVTASGELYSWGRGNYGRLGHGSSDDHTQPAIVAALKGQKVIDMSCGSGDAQTLAVTDAGLYIFKASFKIRILYSIFAAGVEFRWSWGTAILALEKFELMRAPQQFQ